MTLLTVKEVAKILKISEQQVRKLFREGLLPAAKIAREWRIPEELLVEAVMASME